MTRRHLFGVTLSMVGILVAVVAIDAPAAAQVPGWQGGFGATDFQIESLIYWQGDLIAAGTFTNADGGTVNHVARWDGLAWHPLGSGMNLPVHSLTVFGTDLVAAGEFTLADGQPAARVARWTGSTWQQVGNGFPSQYGVMAIGVHGSELIAAGLLPGYNYVARLFGNTWQTLGNSATHVMTEMTQFSGDLVLGGHYGAGTDHTNFVVRRSGNGWFDITAGLNGSIGALTVWNGQLVAGGEFTASAAGPVNHVAVWTGTGWGPIGSGVDGPVHSLAVAPDGNLVVGGDFAQAGSTAAAHIATWNGHEWSALGSGTNGIVYALAAATELAVGGKFSNAGGTSVASLALWNGNAWTGIAGLAGGNGLSDRVYALTMFRDDVIVGGDFLRAGGVTVNRIGRWDGTAWHAMQGGMNGPVYALAVYNDQLIAGGAFTTAGGTTQYRIARWDGATWGPVGPGFDGAVRALAVFEGDLVAGGEFSIFQKIARWNGSTWQSMYFGFDNTVYALTVQGTTLVAGGIMTYAYIPLNHHIARWNGTSWENIGSGLGPATIYSLAVMNGELYAGGTMLGGVSRWNGSSWVLPYGGVFGSVRSMAPIATGLVVGGTFYNAGGVPANNIARWDGVEWHAYDQGVTATPNLETTRVDAIAGRAHEFYSGGMFLGAGENASTYIGHWWEPRTSDVPSTVVRRPLLLVNWPNPSNPATTIHFDPVQNGPAVLAVYDMSGALVRTLVRGTVPGTPQQVLWNGTDAVGRAVPSGVYVCRLNSSAGTASRKLTLLR